jgi:hypothetical protein
MSLVYSTSWKAISDQIKGLVEAGQFYLTCMSIHRSDEFSIVKRTLWPHFQDVLQELSTFHEHHKNDIPAGAAFCMKKFIDRWQPHLTMTEGDTLLPPLVQAALASLISFQAEMTYQLSDLSVVAKRLSERAFTHLQRSIIADSDIQKRWKKAFEGGEVACEKLGGVALLLHGI